MNYDEPAVLRLHNISRVDGASNVHITIELK